MSKGKKIFQAYLDREAKAVETFKENMERIAKEYEAILEKERKANEKSR